MYVLYVVSCSDITHNTTVVEIQGCFALAMNGIWGPMCIAEHPPVIHAGRCMQHGTTAVRTMSLPILPHGSELIIASVRGLPAVLLLPNDQAWKGIELLVVQSNMLQYNVSKCFSERGMHA